MQSSVLFVDEVFLGLDVLFFCLFLEVVSHLNSSLSLLLSFLLLSDCQFFISQFPEFGKLHLFHLLLNDWVNGKTAVLDLELWE